MKVLSERVTAFGHPLISATHPTTLEITKEKEITEKADCIIGVSADKSLSDFGLKFKRAVRNPNTIIKLKIEVNGKTEVVTGHGHPNLTYESKIHIVSRKSSYICKRTLMIHADKAAKDLNRLLVKELRKESAKIKIHLYAYTNQHLTCKKCGLNRK